VVLEWGVDHLGGDLMQWVSTKYLNSILATRRQVLGKVIINYSDPFLDPSVSVEVNEAAYISQPLQSADNQDEATHKWASLDGSWVLDGTYFLCPDTAKAALINQMGWWGSTLAGADGAFAEPYPTLATTFSARPVRCVVVNGDDKREEYPVDFNIRIYAGETLLHTVEVVGNVDIRYQKDLSNLSLSGVTKLVLQITKWSRSGRQVKILEFFAVVQETYIGDDLFNISLLEEREFSDGSLPIGNISANELTVQIHNADRKFDAGNTASEIYGLVRPNRRIRAWLGLVVAEADYETEDDTMMSLDMLSGDPTGSEALMFLGMIGDKIIDGGGVEWIPLGVFWCGEWTIPEDDIYAETTALDRLDLLKRNTFAGPVYQNITVYDLAKKILDDTGYPHWIDTSLKNYVVPWAWFENDTTHRECLRIVAEASLSQVYADRSGVIRVEGPGYLKTTKTTPVKALTTNDYFGKDNPANYTELANYIEITTQPLVAADEDEIYRSDDAVSITAGETQTVTIEFSTVPAINCSATLDAAEDDDGNTIALPAGLTIQDVDYYAWGAEVTIGGATEDGVYILVINGRVLEVQGAKKITASDAQSIKENGKISYTFADNHLLQSATMAQAIADKCLELSKDPRHDLELDWRGDPALELGDRITVPDSKTTTADFYITSSNLEYDGTLSATLKGKKVLT
jgi:hypothetical protein